ncbi:bifunctional diguanylate cyclase/phosphodiesterase [Caproiciproducens faecalis]|uniref:EAL domain-containing protein n=1 Tax=Caproiciproducens faecalis TaxID=2820301 RepID=A0ABS7DL04_9FIRM|nr:EAL domain-containing protein [Caproiciproducens faecalis]MBW7571799.1 EAL domain-containing protein [Caproiciproducens faecalis]
MKYQRNKIILIIAVVVAVLMILGLGFVMGVRGILTRSTQTSLQKISEQGANAVHVAIEGNLDVLSALSEQNGLTEGKQEQMRILSDEARRKNFVRVAFVDRSGHAITSDGKEIRINERDYFKKAIAGYANISGELYDLFAPHNKIIAYAVPVIRSRKVVGALVATTPDDEDLNIMDHIAVDSDYSIYIISNTGQMISNRNGQERFGNFFQYIGPQSSQREISAMRRDFLSMRSGKGACTVNGTAKLVGYSSIPQTDDWMFAVLVAESKIMAPGYQIMVMSAVLLGLLILEFIIAAIGFFKFKKSSYEANVRRKEDISYYTYTDPLTNLPNRKGIEKNISEWIKFSRANGKNGAAFFLDIDNFQSVNNTFGIEIGDSFLASAAARLASVEGENIMLGRIGGDEFVLLISNVNTSEELEKYAKDILNLFKEPFLIHGNVIQLSCSVGAILFNYRENMKNNGFDEIINRGEFVLHEAKSKSKGSYALFNDDFGITIDRQHQMERELKLSIHNNELCCYFQPQYDYEKKSIVGFESLARWHSAKFGMVSPVTFISMAENTGFIKELGRFVVDQTFAFAKTIQGRGIRVSFNASPVELLQADYVNYVIERFCYYGLTPGSVAIEVTESSLIESFDEVIKKFKILSGYGIYVYLDDFGTGFSSLTYLKNLPIHSVKIDKSFIDEVVTDRVGRDIVDMIVRLAKRLNLEVIAEGVETQAQIECIYDCGCRMIQGYFISPPVPWERALSLLDVMHK